MTETKITNPKIFNQFVDFLVLGLTFFLSCMMLSVNMQGSLILQTLIYATTLVLFLHLANRLIVGYKKSLSSTTRHILSNAAGITVGTSVMLLLEKLFSAGGNLIVVVIFSGIMAFFILGTLYPFVHIKSSSVH